MCQKGSVENRGALQPDICFDLGETHAVFYKLLDGVVYILKAFVDLI